MGGDPHATYAYIAADAAAKEKGTEPGAEVRSAPQRQEYRALGLGAAIVLGMCGMMASHGKQAELANAQNVALIARIVFNDAVNCDGLLIKLGAEHTDVNP